MAEKVQVNVGFWADCSCGWLSPLADTQRQAAMLGVSHAAREHPALAEPAQAERGGA